MFMVRKGLLNLIQIKKYPGQVNAFMINLMFAHKSLNALDYKLKFSGAILNLGFYTKLNALKFTYSLSIFFLKKIWDFVMRLSLVKDNIIEKFRQIFSYY